MSEEPDPARKGKRPYVSLRYRRKRGGQPGNLNAVKHGGFSAPARERNRKLSALLKEARWAILQARRFAGKRRRTRQKFETNIGDRPDETGA